MARRLLILMDGKRSGQELAPMVAGHDFSDLLRQLFEKNCIEVVNSGAGLNQRKISNTPETALKATPNDPLAALPAAESRSDKETEMARNFMVNTVNMEFGQHMRISVIETIGACKSAQELRQAFPLWHATMGSSRNAAKELNGLQEKLFRVL